MVKKRHPVDLRIAIADLFLEGPLHGPTPLNRVADLAEATPTSTYRAILALNFAVAKVGSKIRRVRKLRSPRLWARPRRWALPKGSKALTRAIYDLYEQGRVQGAANTDDLAERLGVSSAKVGRSLKALGFTRSDRRKYLGERVEWATVTPPVRFPALFLRQRELRRSGLGAYAVVSITEAAAGVDGLVREAIRALDLSAVPLHVRGALKSKVRSIIADIYYRFSMDNSELGQATLPRVDWSEVAKFSDVRLRQFARIAGRVTQEKDPAGYAFRWVRENFPGDRAQA